MKKWCRIAAFLTAAVMLLCTAAFAEETTQEPEAENLLLFSVDGKDFYQQEVVQMADALHQNGYSSNPSDYIMAIDYLINGSMEEALIEKMGMNQFSEDELDAFTAEAQGEYDGMLNEYLTYYQSNEEVTEEEQKDLEKKVTDYFTSMGFTVEAISEGLRYNAAFDRMIDYLQEEKGIKVTEEEVRAIFDQNVEEHKKLYGTNVADYEVAKQYYNSDIWYTPEGYRGVVQMLLEVDEALLEDYKSKQAALEEAASAEEGTVVENEVTEEDVEKARQAILDSCRETIDEIYARIEKGENFVDMIPEYNIDPGMTDPQLLKDGYAVHKDSILWDPAFVAAAFDENMQKVGDVSAPAVGSYGIYMLHYLRDIPAGPVEMDEDIYAQIEDSLMNNKLGEMYEELIQQSRSEAEIVYNEENLKAFANIEVNDGVLSVIKTEETEETEEIPAE